MANTLHNVLVLSTSYGLNGALETLVTHAYGAGKLRLCGIYLNRSRLIVTLFFIPCAFIFLYTSEILQMMGQSKEGADSAYIYMLYYLPGSYLTCLNDG